MLPLNGMKRTNTEGTWELSAQPGLVVRAERTSTGGGRIVALIQLGIDPTARGIQLRIEAIRTEYLGDQTSRMRTLGFPPEEKIERWANQPPITLALIKSSPADLAPLEGVRDTGKRPDSFYVDVLKDRIQCDRRGVPYAEAIARQNGVESSTVYRWMKEAKRRGIRIEDGRVVHGTSDVEEEAL